jgi:hypothetical protein
MEARTEQSTTPASFCCRLDVFHLLQLVCCTLLCCGQSLQRSVQPPPCIICLRSRKDVLGDDVL